MENQSRLHYQASILKNTQNAGFKTKTFALPLENSLKKYTVAEYQK